MSANKPTPLYFRRPPPRCPVCGMASYSASGVHPQCSARQLDADRMQRLKRAEVPAGAVATGTAASA